MAIPICIFLLIGNARMTIAFQMNPTVPDLYSVEFTGEVVSEPTLNSDGSRLVMEIQLSELNGESVHYRVRLYLRSEELALEGIEYGQTLTCIGNVWPQENATNPYQYDALNALRANGLAGMAAAKLEDVVVESTHASLGSFRAKIRRAISNRIDLLFPENADLVRAFVLGDRNGLDDETKDAFNNSGVAHLICISGMHISMIAMLISKLLSMRLSKTLSTWLTLFTVILYGYLIGFPASLVRATIMFAVFSLAPLIGRPSDSITRLAAALLAMLFFRPFWIYSTGFVLSFSASAGIILLNQPIAHLIRLDKLKEKDPEKNKIARTGQKALRYVLGLLCTTLSAQLATLPVVIACFGAQPPVSILTNLIAVPLAMTAYPLALAALCLSCIWMLPASGIAWIADRLFAVLIALVQGVSAISSGTLCLPQYPLWLVVIHCVLILAASNLTKLKISLRSILPAGLILLAGVSMLNSFVTGWSFKVVFLDADQADAAVVRAEGHVYIFDVGDTYTPVDDYVAGCCMGVDAVFLSHPHTDHAGGLVDLLETMPPKVIYVPAGWFDVEAADSVQEGIDLAMEMGIPIIELEAGDEVVLTDDIVVRVYTPYGDVDSVNDMSLMLELDYRGMTVLFTGDLTFSGEPEESPDVDVLKVPHHGSAKSTSEEFLLQTTPSISVISVGDNSYGHPSEETIARLEAIETEIYRTDQCGAITIYFHTNGKITLKTYLPLEDSQ